MKTLYTNDTVPDLSAAVGGKTIQGVSVDDSGMNDMLVIQFTDGTKLVIEYDWIYGWELIAP